LCAGGRAENLRQAHFIPNGAKRCRDVAGRFPRTLPPSTRSGTVTFDAPRRASTGRNAAEVARTFRPSSTGPSRPRSRRRARSRAFVTPARVLLALAFVLTLGIVEIVSRGTILGWRR
jgi:hypothetical protein